MRGTGATYAEHNGINVCDELDAVNASWMYNWGRNPTVCSGIESVPMLWCTGEVGLAIGGNSEWLLLFNEPDVAVQCNKTPHEGAIATRQASQAYSKRLVSPAVGDIRWLEDWKTEYNSLYGTDPPVDAVAVHCYDWTGSVTGGVEHCQGLVRRAHALNLGPIWIAEWAWMGPQGRQAEQYIRRMVQWLSSERMVQRHAYFEMSYEGSEPWAFWWNTSLTDWETGELTNLGRAFNLQNHAWIPWVVSGEAGVDNG
jgi:hypothetical protein